MLSFFLKFTFECGPIWLNLKMFSNVIRFMSLMCLFFDPHLTREQLDVGVQLRKITV